MENKGLTLLEILGVIVIIGLLAYLVAPRFSKASLNSKIDSTEADLRIFSLDINNYLVDYGIFVIDPSVDIDTYKEEVGKFINNINSNYLTHSFSDEIVVSEDKDSFYVETAVKKDPWNNKYRMYVHTDYDSGGGLIIVVSAGVNQVFEVEGYSEGDFGDDILVIIEPK